jgi:molybdopterin/thiamine biosynthesis adenylyltransferase
MRLDASNALKILSEYDVILDGADNFSTRYLLNDASVLLGKPVVHGSIYRFEGQVTTYWPKDRLGSSHPIGPCYRCQYPEPPPPELAPNCAEAGVLGILPGVIGLLEANEVIKLLLGIGDPLIGRLLTFDALTTTFEEYRIFRDPNCPACGEHATVETLEDIAVACAAALHQPLEQQLSLAGAGSR